MSSHRITYNLMNTEEADLVVAVYERVSAEEQKKSQQGILGQEHVCRDFVQKKFPSVKDSDIRIYKDEAISADKTEIEERPELSRLLHDAKVGQVNVIVCFKQDRLARKVDQSEPIFKSLASIGVQVWEAESGKLLNDASPQMKFMRQVLASVSELEIDNTRARIKATKAGQRARGRFSGGDLPYGFRWDRVNKKIIEVEDEVRVYLSIIHKYLIENKGVTTIARELNESGIPFTTGRKKRMNPISSRWDKENVLSLLKNPILTGKLPVHVIKKFRDVDGKRRVSRVHPRDYELQDAEELRQIMPLSLWYQILDKMEARAISVPRRFFSTTWLLTGLVRCDCDSTMVAKDSSRKGRTYRYYKCPNQLCTSIRRSVRKEEFEQLVLLGLSTQLQKIVQNVDEYRQLALSKFSGDMGQTDEHIKITQSKIAFLDAYLDQIREKHKAGLIDTIVYNLEIRKSLQEIDEYQIFLKNQQEQRTSIQRQSEDLTSTIDVIQLLNQALYQSDDKVQLHRKRAIYLMLIDSIEIGEDGQPVIILRAATGNPIPDHLKRSLDVSIDGAFREVIAGRMEMAALSDMLADSQLRSHG